MPANNPKATFRWKDVIVPSHDLEDIPLRNKQRMLRVLTTSPLALADLIDAAAVVLLSKEAREGLESADRKALEQLQRAMDLCSPDLPNPYVDGQPVVVRDHEKPQYAVVNEMAAPDTRLAVTFGDGYSRYLAPWHYSIRPDDDPQAE